MQRTVGRQHACSTIATTRTDFAVALHWMKCDEAARRVARDDELGPPRRASSPTAAGSCDRSLRSDRPQLRLPFGGIPTLVPVMP